jgi:hypothetical protein
MKLKTKDIHLLYRGSTGGFICSHLILQSQKHFCLYQNYPHENYKWPESKAEFLEQFNEVKNYQWTIHNVARWKNTEVWPENSATEQTQITGLNRLYVTNNPCSENMQIYKQTNINIAIYTDIVSQLEMSTLKNSYWFYNNIYLQNNQRWQNSYSDVKDISWPAVELHDVDLLPDSIWQELLTQHQGFDIFFNYSKSKNDVDLISHFILGSTMKHEAHGEIINIDSEYRAILPIVDHMVKLQDVIRSRGRCLTDLLELPWNPGHADLVDNWVKLHPPELIEQMLSR